MKITGYFSKTSQAEQAVEKLKNLGFNNVNLNVQSHHYRNRSINDNILDSEISEELSGLLLKPHSNNMRNRTFPSLNSNSMLDEFGTYDEMANVNYTLTVDCREDDASKVQEIISKMGGQVQNYNFKHNKLVSNAELNLGKAINNYERD